DGFFLGADLRLNLAHRGKLLAGIALDRVGHGCRGHHDAYQDDIAGAEHDLTSLPKWREALGARKPKDRRRVAMRLCAPPPAALPSGRADCARLPPRRGR